MLISWPNQASMVAFKACHTLLNGCATHRSTSWSAVDFGKAVQFTIVTKLTYRTFATIAFLRENIIDSRNKLCAVINVSHSWRTAGRYRERTGRPCRLVHEGGSMQQQQQQQQQQAPGGRQVLHRGPHLRLPRPDVAPSCVQADRLACCNRLHYSHGSCPSCCTPGVVSPH
jgi:hypothetical protein